jgi:hypothetical protein
LVSKEFRAFLGQQLIPDQLAQLQTVQTSQEVTDIRKHKQFQVETLQFLNMTRRMLNKVRLLRLVLAD